MSGAEEVHARYDEVADLYVEIARDVSDQVTTALFGLLGDVASRRVLDLACGHGRVARELARRGAQVVGFDLSSVLLDRAREHEQRDPLGIVYVRGDATSTSALDGHTFDAVVCNYGLSDIDDLDGALATVSRVLPEAGTFLFSIVHPCFPGWGSRYMSSWRPGIGYFEEGWWIIPDRPGYLRAVVGANHRTLSTYINALAVHGLVVEQMTEPEDPLWANEAPGAEPVPIYLVARCRKR